MKPSSYPPATAVADEVERYFEACTDADSLVPRPSAAIVEETVSTAFWASLRREEGQPPRISIAYLAPEAAEKPLRFSRPIPFAAAALTKLAPALERPSIHLGVWPDEEGALMIWGTTYSLPFNCYVLEVIEPGVLVIKRRRGEPGSKFANVVVFYGDRAERIDERGGGLVDHGPVAAALLASISNFSWSDPLNVLVQLAVSMRDHGQGGTLLIVPDESEDWRESIATPISYEITPSFDSLTQLAHEPSDEEPGAIREQLRQTVAGIGGLTAVDGATVLTDRYRVLAFGAKIVRRGQRAVDRVVTAEPIRGSTPESIETARVGGTRHLSAAQFVHDQPNSLALVASQDGRFTVFADANPGDGTVRAYRIDSLLL